MSRRLRSSAWLMACALLLASPPPGSAGDLADFNAAAETALGNARAAAGYLRTGNIDLAAIELDEMAATWGRLRDRFETTPPDAFDGNALYGPTLAKTAKRIDAAIEKIEAEDAPEARDMLNEIRVDLSAMRRASGLYLLADAVLHANAVMEILIRFKEPQPDLTDPAIGTAVIWYAAKYEGALARCDSRASEEVRADPEFRRLIDGALFSLARIPQAIISKDNDLLFRLLIELRSFDNLLYFRYG